MPKNDLISNFHGSSEEVVSNLLEFFLNNGGDITQLTSQPEPAIPEPKPVRAPVQRLSAPVGISETSAHAKSRDRAVVSRIYERVHSGSRDVSSMDFRGTCFVITGKLFKTRKEITKMIEDRGGQVADSVNHRVDCLICGEKPGSKLVKAHQLGKPIISEDDFLRMINGQF